MGASNYPGLKLSKGTHGSLQTEQVRKARRSKDERESDKVRERSGGRCEVVVGSKRCHRASREVHHMLPGRSRLKGVAVLAQHKQHVCSACHADITGPLGGKRLIRVGGAVPWFTDSYRRVK